MYSQMSWTPVTTMMSLYSNLQVLYAIVEAYSGTEKLCCTT